MKKKMLQLNENHYFCESKRYNVMNTRIKKSVIMAALMLPALVVSAQFATRNAKIVAPGLQEGFYYSVPMTVLRMDFRIEESVLMEGPYCAYADRYLGVKNVIRGKSHQFKIIDVAVNTTGEADPDATFFVEFTHKAAKSVNITLDNKGVLESFSVGEVAAKANDVVANTAVTEAQESPIDTSNVFRAAITPAMGRPLEQQARAAAEKITEIRDAKMKLLTGYQEVAFSGEAIAKMYAELDAMEEEYLSLFVGKRLTKTVVRSLYVKPIQEEYTLTVGKFSSSEGLSSSLQDDGETITVTLYPSMTTTSIKAPSHSAIETATHENKLVYRIPETADVKVTCGSRLLAEQRCSISQLGVLLLAPIGKGQNSLRFDVTTGQLIGVSRE